MIRGHMVRTIHGMENPGAESNALTLRGRGHDGTDPKWSGSYGACRGGAFRVELIFLEERYR